MKRIVAVNAGPRKGWNTDLLIKEAARGAEDAGAAIDYVDLYRLERFTGCISCFGCKRPKTMGRCIYKDGLSLVLKMIREADGLIIGSPNYLGNMTAGFRALYERLVFQSLTYNAERPNCNGHLIPVLLIMTSNNPKENYAATGYDRLLKDYQNTLGTFVGPTEVLASGNTLQVADYSQYDWTFFDPEERKRSREEDFPKDLEEAYRLGSELLLRGNTMKHGE